MFWKKEKPKSEVITKEDELQLIIDLQETKKKYDEMLAELREKQRELKEVSYQARLLLKKMNMEINNES